MKGHEYAQYRSKWEIKNSKHYMGRIDVTNAEKKKLKMTQIAHFIETNCGKIKPQE